MAGFTMTEASEILKRDYLPVVREQIPSRTPLFERIKKGTEDVVGEEARLALRINRNQGVGSRANGAQLPTAGQQQYKQIGVTTKNFYGRLEIAGKVFRAARTDKGAFLNAVDAELKGMVEAMAWDMNRQIFSDGTGVLATLDAVTSSTTMTVQSTFTRSSTATRWLANNMIVDILDASAADAELAADRTISALDKSARTFTISGAAITTEAADKVVRANAADQEITGLRKVFSHDGSSNTLYGIDRTAAANAYFLSQRLHNSGTNRAISEVLLQQAIDDAEVNAGGRITLMISTHGLRRAYQDLLIALKRYTEPQRLTGGWTSLDYNGIDWVADPDARQNVVYMLDESTWKIHTMIPELFDWGEEDNQILRQVSNYDSYEAFMVSYLELVCDTPAKNVVLEDLTES